MDPLSDVLSLLAVQNARCTRFEAGGGAWALRFPAKPALKFAAVLSGACWIDLLDGAPRGLGAGDAFLLANAPPYVLGNDRNVAPKDGIALFDWERSDVAHYGGAETVLVACSFAMEAVHAQLLLNALPRFMLVPATNPAAGVMRSTIAILEDEIRTTRMGASVVTRRLADVLLVQALRAYVEGTATNVPGWIGALADPKIAAALALMHGQVARRWTVEDLAAAVGMSRSAFASRFRTSVGVAPLDYLLRWRMELARDALRRGQAISNVAGAVGYASESAFGAAFKRIYGSAPRRYSTALMAE